MASIKLLTLFDQFDKGSFSDDLTFSIDHNCLNSDRLLDAYLVLVKPSCLWSHSCWLRMQPRCLILWNWPTTYLCSNTTPNASTFQKGHIGDFATFIHSVDTSGRWPTSCRAVWQSLLRQRSVANDLLCCHISVKWGRDEYFVFLWVSSDHDCAIFL